MSKALLPYLPIEQILTAYAKGRGDELGSGKFESPESSAALVANTFGFFLTRPGDLPVLPKLTDCGWPAESVALEACCRFPWSGGEHPWLDVLIETRTHLIGIESKRYEPFRSRKPVKFSAAYRRPVWGDRMLPYERLLERLSDGSLRFLHLDAPQLVKHAFGIRTEAGRRHKLPALMYLFAEPKGWPDGSPISEGVRALHAKEINLFASEVAGAEVKFSAISYSELLHAFARSSLEQTRAHADRIAALLAY